MIKKKIATIHMVCEMELIPILFTKNGTEPFHLKTTATASKSVIFFCKNTKVKLFQI